MLITEYNSNTMHHSQCMLTLLTNVQRGGVPWTSLCSERVRWETGSAHGSVPLCSLGWAHSADSLSSCGVWWAGDRPPSAAKAVLWRDAWEWTLLRDPSAAETEEAPDYKERKKERKKERNKEERERKESKEKKKDREQGEWEQGECE